ncbi:MAG TPA: hypothetical protein VLB44_21275 [Kofleriaceae bacterium]|nr:hypothetical protein [Kofleriaceae bacterium]
MKTRLAYLLAILVACGKGGGQEPAPAPAPAPGSASGATVGTPTPPPPAAAAKPQAKDDGAKQLLAKGTTCELQQGSLPLDCAEYKAMGEYGFQNQGSDAVAETCASFLQDPDAKKRLLAATCLDHMNARAVTPQLGAALDAIEAEKDVAVRKQIAWGIKGAEAVTAKLDDRVIAIVTRLAADPKTEDVAGDLFDTLFPQYLAGSGPKPPAKAQALAIEALGRDGTAMQHSAFNAIKLLDDKPAVCAALAAAIRPDAKQWANAADAFADIKDACIADLPRVIDLTLARLAAGEEHLDLLKKLDRVFELDAPTRAKIAKAIKAATGKAPDWQRKSFNETAAAFSKPAVKP